MRIISFPLWGTAPKYLVGALRNAELAPALYPGWRCRFSCGASVPADIRAALAAFPHVDLDVREEPGDWRAMFWRLEAGALRGLDTVIFRDTDSRLNLRERAAVDAWLSSGREIHVMRDHPFHGVPILGGMWGARGGTLAGVTALIAAFPKENENHVQVDQDFLAAVIAPRVVGKCLEHDEYFSGHPFPTRRRWREFVGQPFDEHERPLIQGPTSIERRARRVARVLLKGPAAARRHQWLS